MTLSRQSNSTHASILALFSASPPRMCIFSKFDRILHFQETPGAPSKKPSVKKGRLRTLKKIRTPPTPTIPNHRKIDINSARAYFQQKSTPVITRISNLRENHRQTSEIKPRMRYRRGMSIFAPIVEVRRFYLLFTQMRLRGR